MLKRRFLFDFHTFENFNQILLFFCRKCYFYIEYKEKRINIGCSRAKPPNLRKFWKHLYKICTFTELHAIFLLVGWGPLPLPIYFSEFGDGAYPCSPSGWLRHCYIKIFSAKKWHLIPASIRMGFADECSFCSWIFIISWAL